MRGRYTITKTVSYSYHTHNFKEIRTHIHWSIFIDPSHIHATQTSHGYNSYKRSFFYKRYWSVNAILKIPLDSHAKPNISQHPPPDAKASCPLQTHTLTSHWREGFHLRASQILNAIPFGYQVIPNDSVCKNSVSKDLLEVWKLLAFQKIKVLITTIEKLFSNSHQAFFSFLKTKQIHNNKRNQNNQNTPQRYCKLSSWQRLKAKWASHYNSRI